jgi:hypothetical protein
MILPHLRDFNHNVFCRLPMSCGGFRGCPTTFPFALRPSPLAPIPPVRFADTQHTLPFAYPSPFALPPSPLSPRCVSLTLNTPYPSPIPHSRR